MVGPRSPSPRLPVLGLALSLSLLGCVTTSHRKVERIDAKVDQVLDNQTRMLANQNEMMAELDELVEASRRQGTGEITLFFPWHDTRINRGTPQYARFVAWLDHLALHANGREILFVAVGSASDWKRTDWNQELSTQRAWSPKPVVAQHLVHLPHRWLETYGVGSGLVPGEASGRTWRHVRVIAVYDEGQLPELPAR